MLRRKLTWVAVLYFAQGFPFGIVVDNLPIYFRASGVSLVDIGLMSLLGLPWTLKVLWAPLVDRYFTTRHWTCGALLVMALLLYVMPFLPTAPMTWFWLLLPLFTLASATQDIAIDAHTIRMLAPEEQGVANGIRVSAYRAALIVAGGALVALAGYLRWVGIFHIAAGILLVLAYVLWTRLPPGVAAENAVGENWWAPLWQWLRRPGSATVILFALSFKLGDSSMGPMIKPFWVDRGFSPAEIGMISTTVGVAASVVGALIGGALTSRWGMLAGLTVFGLLQAASNIGYALVAYTDAGRAGVYAASVCESLTGGMGTAAFTAYLMSACDPRRAATEYALLSAIFALPRQLAGGFSGWAATALGYANYFSLTTALALPALLLLPWLPLKPPRKAE